jgi:Pretoxin HINT domain
VFAVVTVHISGSEFAIAGCVADIATMGAGGALIDLGKAGNRVDNLIDGTKHLDDLADANHWIDRAITVGACHSFDPSTEVVMADGTLRQIGDVAVGDQVIAIDPTSGQSSSREVSVVWRHIDDNLATLNVELPDGSTSTVDTTTTHPFWVLSTGWVNAGDLDAGDLLSSPDGQVKVLNVDERDHSAEMVDLTVEGLHTYQIAIDDTPVLVHNNNQACDLVTEAVDELPIRRVYEHNPKHGPAARVDSRGREVSRAPWGDCQAILDCSVQVKPTSPHRVGIEPETGLEVVLRRHDVLTTPTEIVEKYHGYIPGG